MKKVLIVVVVLVIVYFLGPVPQPPVFSSKMPVYNNTLAQLEDSLHRYEMAFPTKENNEAMIHWYDNKVEKTEYVIMYVHGYSASHMEGAPTHLDVAKKYGANLLLLRLPEHGVISENPMLNYNADSLWEATKSGLALAKKMGDKVIVMSTSTGGTLSIKLASEYPNDVFALINMSPNVNPKPWNAPLLNNHWGHQLAMLAMGGDFRTLHNLMEHPEYTKYWYAKYRVESLVNMQQLVEHSMTEETFEKVTCPSLTLVYYEDDLKNDEVIDVEKVFWMHDHLASEVKELDKLPGPKTHTIGCGIFSEDIEGVEAEIFDFCENKLHMTPVQQPLQQMPSNPEAAAI
ncbi:MAG: hypothetical protein SchgKO_17890 [Schleiferiaceae bacterium]